MLSAVKQVRLKLGYRAPHARAESLQRGCGIPLTVKTSVAMPDRPSASLVERMAHYILASARSEGEWFNVSEADAIAAIHEAICQIESGLKPPTAQGTPILVRLQSDILAKLDRARGGMTRPQKIRSMLDTTLPR